MSQTQPQQQRSRYAHANPPKTCDCCRAPITVEFSDARLPFTHVWANICPPCCDVLGVRRYGVGIAQRYTKFEDGKFYKVEG